MSIKLDDFTRAYIECALWSSTDDNETPLDSNYDASDIAPQTLASMIEDCADFQASQADLLDKAQWVRPSRYLAPNDPRGMYSAANAGHDFWLTRNGHGAGFWDRGLGRIGDELSKAAKVYGACDLYIGDNGLIYC